MNEKKIAKVTEILLDQYILMLDKEQTSVIASVRGNAKRKSNILVGDLVEVVSSYDKNMIERILPRKNEVIRPPVANIDQMIIVLSIANPPPDYSLLDKELILCRSKKIVPFICMNKMDLAEDNKEEMLYMQSVYGKLSIPILYMSAKEDQGIESLKEVLKEKVSALSGNSGVGKSSITKKLLQDVCQIEVGEVGDRTKRGKHTTKYVKLYEVATKSYILDTPGFSSYELFGVEYKQLKSYYPEFETCHCDFDDCNHVIESENVCDVKRQVKEGNIDKGRYDRYVSLFQKLKEIDAKKYK